MKIDICFRNQWPSRKSFPDQCLLIYDRELLKYSKAFPKWAKTFPAQLALKAGESTKSLEAFPSLLNQVLKKTINFSSREMTIIVVGGGSLTDFGGFLASVLKRGVRLILIPSTWLAAIDSAHGGKNGLNFQKYKNQIGTFYFPERIELIRELLVSQPEQRGKEAFGELLKIALISGNKLFQEIQKSTHRDGAWFYRHLAEAIKAKNKIVQMDPFEKNGIRHWLNLGHSLAHAIERVQSLSHGDAVLYGTVFNVLWSHSLGILSEKDFEKIIQARFWRAEFDPDIYLQILQMPDFQIRKALGQDKKRGTSGLLNEPFVAGIGKIILRKVSVEEFIQEYRRQKNRARKAIHGSFN